MDTLFAILDTVVSNIGVFSEIGYHFPNFGYSFASLQGAQSVIKTMFQRALPQAERNRILVLKKPTGRGRSFL